METLVLATGNAHKVIEIRGILGERFHYCTLKDFPSAPEVVEDAGTFAGNATKKAVGLAKFLSALPMTEHVVVMADDSGLEVDALNGAPGVYSARFAALDSGQPGNSPNADNNAKLLRLLKDLPAGKRTARFRCAIALTPAMKPASDSASPVCYAD
jgi:XTP/dITP diphosphohydrolase